MNRAFLDTQFNTIHCLKMGMSNVLIKCIRPLITMTVKSVTLFSICIFKLLKQRAEGLWSKDGGILRLKYLERMTEWALAWPWRPLKTILHVYCSLIYIYWYMINKNTTYTNYLFFFKWKSITFKKAVTLTPPWYIYTLMRY